MGTDIADRQRQKAVRASADRARRALSPAFVVAASLGAVILLALIGWLVWTRGALVGLRFVEFDSPLSLAALGFLAGIGGFFAPCAFALFPGYVSYYLSAAGEAGPTRRAVLLGLTSARPVPRPRGPVSFRTLYAGSF